MRKLSKLLRESKKGDILDIKEFPLADGTILCLHYEPYRGTSFMYEHIKRDGKRLYIEPIVVKRVG